MLLTSYIVEKLLLQQLVQELRKEREKDIQTEMTE
jgi:hypothetical protein